VVLERTRVRSLVTSSQYLRFSLTTLQKRWAITRLQGRVIEEFGCDAQGVDGVGLRFRRKHDDKKLTQIGRRLV
jgi:hypothetical protein